MIAKMWKKLRTYFSDPYSIKMTTYAQDLSSIIRWSALSKVGRSRIMQMTIIAPFLGSFLLFNNYTQSYLKMADFFLEGIGQSGITGSASYLVTYSYFLYFGLFFLGVGSILFGLFCPDEIKKQSDIQAYSKEIDLTASPVLAKSNFRFVLDQFFDSVGNVGEEYEVNTAEFTPEIDSDFYNLISEMFMQAEIQNNKSETPLDRDSEIDDKIDDDDNIESAMEFYSGASGHPNIYNIAHAAWSNPKIIWAFTQPFIALSSEFAKDIAFVKFKMMDHQKFPVRVLTFFLYFTGFALLAIPSLTTFYRVLLGLIY